MKGLRLLLVALVAATAACGLADVDERAVWNEGNFVGEKFGN